MALKFNARQGLSVGNNVDVLDTSGNATVQNSTVAGNLTLSSISTETSVPNKFFASTDTRVRAYTAPQLTVSIDRNRFISATNGMTVEVGNHYTVDTTAGVLSVTLPPASGVLNGDTIEFSNKLMNWGTNNFTVIAPANTYIQNGAVNLLCDQNIGGFTLRCAWSNGTQAYWNIIGSNDAISIANTNAVVMAIALG